MLYTVCNLLLCIIHFTVLSYFKRNYSYSKKSEFVVLVYEYEYILLYLTTCT